MEQIPNSHQATNKRVSMMESVEFSSKGKICFSPNHDVKSPKGFIPMTFSPECDQFME